MPQFSFSIVKLTLSFDSEINIQVIILANWLELFQA